MDRRWASGVTDPPVISTGSILKGPAIIDKYDLDLLAIGEAMVLITPDPGNATHESGTATTGTAGAESNVAIGAALLGASAAWHSRVGGGPLGELVLAQLANRGVDVSTVQIDQERPTGLLVKSPHPTSPRIDYYRWGSAASMMSQEDLPLLPAARVVHTTGVAAALSRSSLALVRSILKGAVAPATTSFDINYRASLWPDPNTAAITLIDLARAADIVFVGRDEAQALWGTASADEVRALLPSVKHLVVKDGGIEAVEYESDRRASFPARRVEIVDPVGAGDAFAAGWIAAYLRGEEAARRLRSGHQLAERALRSPTDQPSADPADRKPDSR